MTSPLNITTFLSSNSEELYRHLGEQLHTQLDLPVSFRVGESYSDFLAEDSALVFACGFWYLRKAVDYEPLAAPVMYEARYQNRPVYYADLIVNAAQQNHASDLATLNGTTFGFNEVQSFSGYHALVAELVKRQETLNFFGQLVQTGSHLNSIEKLLKAEIDCATIDSTVLDFELAQRPDLREQLAIVKSLGPYPAPPLLVHKQVPAELRAKILSTVLSLPQAVLNRFGVVRYEPVNRAFYAPLATIYATQSAAATAAHKQN